MSCAALLLAAGSARAQAPSRIDIDGTKVFPESLSSASNGTLYIGGQGSGTVYRALPGESVAKPWILPGTGGMLAVFGVLADESRGALWVCSVDRSDKQRLGTSLMRFNLQSGAAMGKYPYPEGGTCNDVTIAHDGTAYASDTLNGRVLQLAPGAASFTEIVRDPRLVGADGIVLTPDGKLYVNTYGTGLLFRVEPGVDGRAGSVTQIATSQPLVQPDGMRIAPDGSLLMAEGQGRIDRVNIAGDAAAIQVLHQGFLVPSAVTVTGDTIWVTETKFNYQRDPALKGQDPGVFHVYAVPLRSR